ncbi:hypothetical protein [Luteimonas abyssi]|uniref:hypothetical protein n=1 Tax=Luteimonas abyssi TaxID=1247514 RepID=UPI0012F98D28|nr:hypothetical protein [Luteimonas abyssi]
MTLKEYREIRIDYETKFQDFIDEAKKKYKKEFDKAMGEERSLVKPGKILSFEEVNCLLREFNELSEDEKNELFLRIF